MPLEILKDPEYLVALFPPGNVAAELQALKRPLLGRLDAAKPLPFPCAAGLAWFERPPEDPGRLEELAAGAPRLYDRYRILGGILYLGAEDSGDGPPTLRGSPLLRPAAWAGFPLVRLPEASEGAPDPTLGLPPPPRVAFRTFLAFLLRIRRGNPWYSAQTWEAVQAVRYPLRRKTRA
ncbi:MAG: hypothetical protein GX430_04945 [Treponema sp.]|nr:hypothetical protein [Treponema sp.]